MVALCTSQRARIVHKGPSIGENDMFVACDCLITQLITGQEVEGALPRARHSRSCARPSLLAGSDVSGVLNALERLVYEPRTDTRD